MKIKIFEFNPVGENTFVLYDETKECVIIDAGCFVPQEEQTLSSFIEENGLTVKHLINTHLHFDHIFGSNYVSRKYNVPLEACTEDQFLLDGFLGQLRLFGFNAEGEAPVIGKELKEGDIVEFGNQKLQAIHVPGHSPGSLVYYNEKEKCMFTGDVLFNTSIGRTDLTRGDYNLLISGIKNKLMTLPANTVVYPGHGPSTTIGYEKDNNPYL